MAEEKPGSSLLHGPTAAAEAKELPGLDAEVGKIAGTVQRIRANFDSGRTRPLEWRRRQIEGIIRMMKDEREAYVNALKSDLGATEFWAQSLELSVIEVEAKATLRDLAGWMKPRSVGTPLLALPASSYLVPEPYGVVLIIAPWNYPVSLVLVPMMAAIAAGNAVVFKPSEVSGNCSAIMGRLVQKYVDPDCIVCIEGGVAETTELLKQRFDKIMYTGNGTIAKVIMRAAAEHLTPVILELGGKSPAIVAKDCSITNAAKRIAWGKWVMNHGQTCISPDYVYVDAAIRDKFVAELKKTLLAFYGENPKACADVSRIINENHTRRLAALLDGDDTIAVLHGGDVDVPAKYIAPTVVSATPGSKVMRDEIFGPILPILTYTHLDEVIQYINSREKPLALYLFSNSRAVKNEVLARTSAGGMCINDVVMHAANPELPFGGVGGSGMGAYHGAASFDSFSHMKPVMEKYFSDPSLRFPPYTAAKVGIFRFAVSKNRNFNCTTCLLVLFILGAMAAFGVLIWRASLAA